MTRIFRLFFQQKDGATAVEAAFILPVFLAFTLGIIFFSHAYMTRQSMLYGLDKAGRYAMLNPGASTSDVETAAKNNMSGIDGNNVTVTASTSTDSGVNYYDISASYTYDMPTIVSGGSGVTLSKSISVPLN